MDPLPPRDSEAVIRDMYARLSAGDIEAWLETVTDDCSLENPPEMPEAHVYRGRDGLRTWAEEMFAVAEAWDWRLEELIAEQGDLLFGRLRLTVHARGSGLETSQVVFHLAELRGSRLRSVRSFFDEAQARRAAEEAGMDLSEPSRGR